MNFFYIGTRTSDVGTTKREFIFTFTTLCEGYSYCKTFSSLSKLITLITLITNSKDGRQIGNLEELIFGIKIREGDLNSYIRCSLLAFLCRYCKYFSFDILKVKVFLKTFMYINTEFQHVDLISTKIFLTCKFQKALFSKVNFV